MENSKDILRVFDIIEEDKTLDEGDLGLLLQLREINADLLMQSFLGFSNLTETAQNRQKSYWLS